MNIEQKRKGFPMRSGLFVTLSLIAHAGCAIVLVLYANPPVHQEMNDSPVEIVSTPAAGPTLARADIPPTQVIKAPMARVRDFAKAEKPERELPQDLEKLKITEPAVKDDSDSEKMEDSPSVESQDQETESGEDPSLAGAEAPEAGTTQGNAISYLDLKQAPGNKAPEYPLNARKQGHQGQVELLYRVTAEGEVTDIQVAKSSGYTDLDQEAARAVAQFRFVPGQEGWARHPVTFTLKGAKTELPSQLRSAQAE